LWAIPIAAVVAVFNGLSSAFLAGRHPVAGGTYEYGYQELNQWAGFSAGWLFLLAKTASAASAALGVGFYLGVDNPGVPVAAVILVAVMVALGIRRTAALNMALVAVTIAAILWFGFAGIRDGSLQPVVAPGAGGVVAAVAFLFVAYTGYGRIATLGEEVRDPERVIPRAVLITLAVAAGLYMTIEVGARAVAGPEWGSVIELGLVDMPFVAFGAVVAMLGVLLNLILGLSRVYLAMGRRGDMPTALATLDPRSEPRNAVLLSTLVVAALTLVGDIGLAWSFSAMTVLLYYGLTNLAALSVDRSRPTAWLGMLSCLLLSFFVPLGIWLTGAGLLAAGLVWKTIRHRAVSVPSDGS